MDANGEEKPSADASSFEQNHTMQDLTEHDERKEEQRLLRELISDDEEED